MARRLNPHPDDAVSALLAAVKVYRAIYCFADLSAPWGFQVDDSSVAKFHLVLEGACVLTLDSGEHVPMECGELVLLPSGAGHSIRDRLSSKVRHLETILAEHPLDENARFKYGGHRLRTRLLCGGFVLADALLGALAAMLPRVLTLDAGSSGLNRGLEPVLDLLADEAGHARPGASAVFTKLADVFLAQVLREYLIEAETASYESEASLSKAFKRAFGVSPGEYGGESLAQPIRRAEWTPSAVAASS